MPRFLISRLSALGDVITTLPVAGSLKSSFPDSHIAWVDDPRFQGVVECCSLVDEVIPWRPSLRPGDAPKFNGEWDVAFDMQGLLKSALAIRRAKAAQRLGYHRQREGSWLFSSRVLPDPTSFHIVDQYVDVARAAGGAETTEFGLKALDDDVTKIRGLLGGIDRFAAINPSSGRASKLWPAEKIAALIDFLSPVIPIVLIGAPSDRAIGDGVKGLLRTQCQDLIGQTSVRELVALVSLATVHIAGDTGSTHLAGALGIPAVGLYGVTHPRRFCPYGQIDRAIFNPAGVSHIEPEAVYNKVMEVLS